MNTIAIIAAKPPFHLLYHFHSHAQQTGPNAHNGPLQVYFWSVYADTFKHFADIQQPDPAILLHATPNFGTLLIQGRDKLIRAAEILRTVLAQVIIYSDESQIENKNTATAALCENTKHFSTHRLGKEVEYGFFEAEYVGLTLGLCMAKYLFATTTRKVTIILDNQGVVKDMSSKKTTSQALTHKVRATSLITKLEKLAPHVKITLRWCPGHKGITGNEKVDKLATTAAKKPLPKEHTDNPTFSGFRAVMKSWAEKESIASYSQQDNKQLGHKPHPKEHLK